MQSDIHSNVSLIVGLTEETSHVNFDP